MNDLLQCIFFRKFWKYYLHICMKNIVVIKATIIGMNGMITLALVLFLPLIFHLMWMKFGNILFLK